MSNQDRSKKIATNTLLLYFRMLVVLVVALYTSRVILHSLGASDYGIYNVVGGVITMMSFLNGALSSGTNRFLTYELGVGNVDNLKKTFSCALNLHICVAIIAIIVGETFGLWLFYEKLIIPDNRMGAAMWVYQLSILTIIFVFTQVPYNAAIIAHENMKIYAYVGLYEACSKLFIAFLIQISPIDNLVFYAILLCLNSILIQLFYRFYTRRRYIECRFRLIKDKLLYNKLLNYSGWDLFGGVAVVCQGQGINILLNMFFGPMVNAARAISIQMQGAMSQFITNFLMAVKPQVIKNYASGNVKEMYSLTFYAAKFSYLLMFLLVLPFLFEMDFLLGVWLGDSVPKDTDIFATIILITALMETFHSASILSYHAIGKIKVGNIIGGSLMISALPISYIVLKLGGPAYAVFVVLFGVNFVQMIFGWYIIHKYEPYSYLELWKKIYFPCILVSALCLIFPCIIKYTMLDGWRRFIVLLFGSEIISVIVMWSVGLNSIERNKVLSIIKIIFHYERA